MDKREIEEIKKILAKRQDRTTVAEVVAALGVRSFYVNGDLSVDVDGDVKLPNIGIRKIPVKFRNVSGGFDCSSLMIQTLYNCAEKVGKTFNCSRNYIADLSLGPRSVGEDYLCRGNKQIMSLQGIVEEVPGTLDASSRALISLLYAPRKIGRDMIVSGNKLSSIQGMVESVGGVIVCSDNKIVTKEHSISVVGTVDFSGNPVEPSDEYETARW
jgi:hypothetical protein